MVVYFDEKVQGIVRRIDHLGRMGVPREFRQAIGISTKEDSEIEMFLLDGGIYLRPLPKNKENG